MHASVSVFLTPIEWPDESLSIMLTEYVYVAPSGTQYQTMMGKNYCFHCVAVKHHNSQIEDFLDDTPNKIPQWYINL